MSVTSASVNESMTFFSTNPFWTRYALTGLSRARIVHCDLKPENVLLSTTRNTKIKLIDFGSACFEDHTVYTYIQSRFYRSPEVLFGIPYNKAIDIWSFGCICAELFLGLPIFPGGSEFDQVSRIVGVIGMPAEWMLQRGRNVMKFFKANPVSDPDGTASLEVPLVSVVVQ